MKVIRAKAVAAVIALLACGAANAQTGTRSGVAIGTEFFNHSYTERLGGEPILREKGRFGGVNAEYTTGIGSGLFFRGRLGVALGEIDYVSYRAPDGTSAGGVSLTGVEQNIGQLELLVGKDLPLDGNAVVTLHTGLGVRLLRDHKQDAAARQGEFGYDREVSYGYIPIGASIGLPVADRTAFIVGAQYNWLVYGRSEVKFSRIDRQFPDVRMDLDGGRGFEANARLRVPIGRHSLEAGPFVRLWNINRSKSTILDDPDEDFAIEFFEPRNRTSQFGLRMSFAF